MFDKKAYQKEYREKNKERIRALKRAYYQANKEKHRAWGDKWAIANPEKIRANARVQNEKFKAKRNEYAREYYKKNREKQLARRAVQAALANGDIKKTSCIYPGCRSTDVEMHHWDYRKPLEVVCFCSRHHGLVDRVYNLQQKFITT